jgi:hypothetical protein
MDVTVDAVGLAQGRASETGPRSSEIPDVPKITACMYKHRADLSSGCRTVMDRGLAASRSSKVAAQ